MADAGSAFLGPRQSTRDAAHALERGDVAARPRRVQEGARAEESDPARGVVQLIVTGASADIARIASYGVRV